MLEPGVARGDEFQPGRRSTLVEMALTSTSLLRDQELLDAARRGDESAFDRIVEVHRAELHAHCYRMLGSLHDADDALQDTLLRAWRGLAAFEGRSSLRTWLYQIATNACLDVIARRPNRDGPCRRAARRVRLGRAIPGRGARSR
jgi:DNA-directed RNA polymerase specialized sigma24 family protein